MKAKRTLDSCTYWVSIFYIAHQNVKNFTEEDVEAYKYALCQSGCTGPLNYYRAAFSYQDLPPGYWRTKIKAPTLVVWVSNKNPTCQLKIASDHLRRFN